MICLSLLMLVNEKVKPKTEINLRIASYKTGFEYFNCESELYRVLSGQIVHMGTLAAMRTQTTGLHIKQNTVVFFQNTSKINFCTLCAQHIKWTEIHSLEGSE